MPYSINGFGTKFYGERDFRNDGTFVTTEWVTAVFVPLIPLRSLRLRPSRPSDGFVEAASGWGENYAVFEKTFPNWKQVLYVYGFFLFMVGWPMLVVEFSQQMSRASVPGSVQLALVFVPLALAGFLPETLRRYARRKVYF